MTISIENLAPEVQEFIRSKIGGEYRTAEEVIEAALLPLAKRQAAAPPGRPRRRPGNGAGKVWVSPGFDEPLEEFKDYM